MLRTEDEPALAQHLQEFAAKLDLPRNLCVVSRQLIFNRNVRDASAWLAGDSLPKTPSPSFALALIPMTTEEAARHIVTALCRLAGETLPIVFCFDQVESLQRTAHDEEALFRFGRMAADLHDADANVFLITCLQSAFLEQFKRAVRTPDYDRIARRSALLEPLNGEQIERLLRSRMDRVPELGSLRESHAGEPFYPLSVTFVQTLALEGSSVPRRVLARAARAFEEAQHGRSSPVPTTAQFLEGELSMRQRDSRAAAPALGYGASDDPGARLNCPARRRGDQQHGSGESGHRRHRLSQCRDQLTQRGGRSNLTPKLKALVSHTPRAGIAPSS